MNQHDRHHGSVAFGFCQWLTRMRMTTTAVAVVCTLVLMSSRRDTIVVAAPLNGSLSTSTNLACDFESAISTLSSFSTSGSSDLSGILKADQTKTKTSSVAAAVSSPDISIATNEIGFEVEVEVVDVAATISTTVVHESSQTRTQTHTSSAASFTSPYQHHDQASTTRVSFPMSMSMSMPMPTPATPCTGASSETDCVTAAATATGTSSSFGSVPVTPVPVPVRCAAANGTQLVGVGDSSHVYTIICDIDFPAEANIYPFVPAGSFDECLMQCEIWNGRQQHDQQKQNASGNAHYCAGFVFAPERIHMGDNCYLKSSVNEPGSATIHLVGATLVTGSGSISRPNPTTWSSSSSMVSSRPTRSGEC